MVPYILLVEKIKSHAHVYVELMINSRYYPANFALTDQTMQAGLVTALYECVEESS